MTRGRIERERDKELSFHKSISHVAISQTTVQALSPTAAFSPALSLFVNFEFVDRERVALRRTAVSALEPEGSLPLAKTTNTNYNFKYSKHNF